MKHCNNCEDTSNGTVTFTELAFEAHEARHEREKRRLWIVIILLASMLFLAIMGFVWYESQFETYYYDQDGEGINNVNNGEQGDVLNESTIEDKAETQYGE